MKTKFISLAATLLLAASVNTAFAAGYSGYFLAGVFNNWDAHGVAFSYDSETGAYTLTREIEGEFKIVHDYDEWLGSNTSPNFLSPTVDLYDAGNMSVPSKSTYTFTIKDNQLTVSGFSLYLAGSFNSWGEPKKMTDNGDGTYSIQYLIPAETEFKIRDSQDQDGGNYYGAVSNGKFYVLNTMYSNLSLVAGDAGQNFYIQRPGSYTFIINSDKKLTVEGFPPTPLYDTEQSNSSTLAEYDNKTLDVELNGRKFYKDGYWNTLCLPFDLSQEELAKETNPLYGADIRTFTSSSFSESNGELTLNFSNKGEVTSITAGTPYIVSWSGGEIISYPVFKQVTIKNVTEGSVGNGPATFKGIFNPYYPTAGDKNTLFIGEENTLYFPEEGSNITIGAFRASFELDGIIAGPAASQIKSFVLNFGDDNEETSIQEIITDSNLSNNSNLSNSYFTLDGRRLNDKPATAGLYIINGKKVVIK